MAVVTENFSIREYTERMRSVDLRGCWPFDGGSEARYLLPPISVRRFKWWADEVDSARSTAILDESPYKDAAPVEISDMDPSAAPSSEEGRRAAKGKQRMPKKRSIVELFAVSPLIAGTVDFDVDNSDEGERCEEEMDVVTRKKKTMRENIMKKKKKRRKKKKNKGIKDGLKLEIRAWEKEKICKPKVISAGQSYMFQNPIYSKKSRKTTRSFVESQKLPAMEKAGRKKHRDLQTSVLLSRSQEVAKKPPVRSILKNHKRGTADQKSSKSVCAKATNLIKFYCKSNRHVTFSVKDDIVGNSSACSSMDFPELQNLCKIFSDVLAASSAMSHSCKSHDLPDAIDGTQDANVCEKETHSSVVSSIEASSTEKNQSSDSVVNLCQTTAVNSSNSSCSGTEKASFAVMVDLNHAIDVNDNECDLPSSSTLSTSCIYSGDPKSRVTFHEKNPNSTSSIHLEVGLPRSSEPSLVPFPTDNFVASSDVTSSTTFLKNPDLHRSSFLVVNNKANERQCNADVNFCRQIEEHHSGGPRSPKGMLSSIGYSMVSKKLGEPLFNQNSVSTCKGKCLGEGFIGLPLNSQGELIQFHSGTKFSEAYNKHNLELGSSHGFSANRHVESNGRLNHLEIMRKKIAGAASYQKHQSDWNQKQCYSTRERVRHWLNFAEMEGSERMEIQKNHPIKGKDVFLHCNSNPGSHSFHENRNGDVSHVSHDFCDRVDFQEKGHVGYHSQPAAQPTMRLMGKNVVVSSMNRDCNGFNDGRTWSNSGNLADQPQFAMSGKPRSQQWMQRECVSHPTIGGSNENLLDLIDSAPNFYHMKALQPTINYMNTQQPQWPSRSTESSVVNHTFKLDMNKHALPPQTFMNKGTHFLGNFMSGEGSVSTGHSYPAIISSHPQDFHQHRLLSSSHCNQNQRVATTQNQFKYQDFGKFSQPPVGQPAAKLPQWLLPAKHQTRTKLSDSHYSDPTAISQPCNVSGANSNCHLSPYHVPIIPVFCGDTDPHKAYGPFVSNACTPSIISLDTPTKSSGDVNKRNISIKKKEKDEIRSKLTSFKNSDDAQKLIKRPADFDDGMINSAKRPLKGQLDSHVPEEPKETEQMNDHPQHLDKAITLDLQKAEHEKGLCRSVNSSNSLQLDNESRSGPTKLIAGAKHILKPCQRIDEESCMPVHSTIIVPTDASGKLFGPEKISRIYNF